MNFSTYVELYILHYNLIVEHFHHLPKKICTQQQSLTIPHPTLRPSPAFCFYRFATSDKLNGTICSLLCLSGFFHQYFFKVHPCCSVCQYLIPLLQLNKYSIVQILHILFIPSLVDGHLDCFQFGPIMNNTAINFCAGVFVSIRVFNFLGYVSESDFLIIW